MQKILIRTLLVIFFLSSQLFAGATYYIDATNGSDQNDGLSEVAAWKTISKVNTSNFLPGDLILFKRGEIWREQLNVPSSGAPGLPIVFGAFGVGPNPAISGADLKSNWISIGNNLYVKKDVYIEPLQIFLDGIKGERVSTLHNCNAERKWYWESDILYLYSTDNPDNKFTSPGVEVSTRQR